MDYQTFAFSIAIQSDGKIIAAGSGEYYFASDFGTSDAFLIRYNLDGSLDTTFNTDGMVKDAGYGIASIAVQSDDKIVTAGRNFTLARYNSDGSLDTSFGTGGKASNQLGLDQYALSVTIQSDGRIVAAGRSAIGNSNPYIYGFALARYNSNGSLDASFDGDGKVVTQMGPGWNFIQDIAIQPDGKITAAGFVNGPNSSDFAVARYNQNGSLDTTFGGGDGITTVDFSNSNDIANGMALDGQGRAVLVGSSDGAFALAQFILGPGAAATHAPFDFDGDGRSDISVFRPSANTWYLNRSQLGFAAFQFGASSDVLTPADFTGDGKTDVAVFRPSSGTWFVLRSEDNTYSGGAFGMSGDIPAPADYDGDGRADIAVYRPGQGTWYLQRTTAGFSATQFGIAEDKPAVGDFDGDGKADISVYRPSTGYWYRLNSKDGVFFAAQFGAAGDKIVPSDYTGDGKTDIAVWRPSNGFWYVLKSEDLTFYGSQFGLATDLPAPGDYDGDGKADMAVFRPSEGIWYLLNSTSGFSAMHFGAAEDKPAPGAFVY